MRSNFPVCEFTGNEIMIKCSFVACILLSELFILLSTVTDYWFTIEATSKYHAGIWRNCYLISLGTNKVCYSVDPTKGWLEAVRALMLVAFSENIIALIFVSLVACRRLLSLRWAGIVSLFTFLTSFTALALYTAQSGIMKETGYKKPGWSYILGWCGGVMALLGSFIGISDNTIGKQIQVATDA